MYTHGNINVMCRKFFDIYTVGQSLQTMGASYYKLRISETYIYYTLRKMSWIILVKSMLSHIPDDAADLIIKNCTSHAASIIQRHAKNMLSNYSRVQRNERIAARFYERLHKRQEPVVILNHKWKWKFDLLVQLTYSETMQHVRHIKCHTFPFKNNPIQMNYIYPISKKSKRKLPNISYHKYFTTHRQ